MGLFVLTLVACTVCAAPATESAGQTETQAVRMDARSELRVGGLGVGVDEELRLFERRLESRVGISPAPEAKISVGVPVLFRTLTEQHAASDLVTLGDVELFGALRLHQSRGDLSKRVWLTPVLKFPTAPVAFDSDGEALASNLQPGCSSVLPGVAAQFLFGQRLWEVSLGGGLALPFPVRDAPHRGLTTHVLAELALMPTEGLRFGTGMKWLFETSGEGIDNEDEPDSGGLVGYVSLGVDVDVFGAFAAGAGVDIPVVLALQGEQIPTPIGSLRVSGAWDLSEAGPPKTSTFAPRQEATRF